MADRAALRRQREDRAPASWKRFYVVLTGRTNKVHQSVVKTFKSSGQTEVTSPGEADYCLVFCPVTTRAGCDVSEAMDHLHPGKAAVLVVMHQTFNPEQVIPPSSRLVEEDQRVKLTLDFLFYREELLKCKINKNMKTNIEKFFPSKKKQKRVEKQQQPPVTSDSKGGSNPADSEEEPGSMDHQEAPPSKPEDGTEVFSSMEEPNRRQQADSSVDVQKTLKEKITTMEQQVKDLVQEMETLQVQKEEKDNKIKVLQNKMEEQENKIQELENKMQEVEEKLKQQHTLVNSGSSGDSASVDREEEPGTKNHQEAPPSKPEDGTEVFSSMERLQHFQDENAKKDEKIKDLEKDVEKLQQRVHLLLRSRSSGGPVPADSEEEPGSWKKPKFSTF